ncbi:LysM peptidoglycan-binding domain-containing protein [Haloferula sp. A504]|uniref:LysM peptidoglycan-binding domain-containing protein n=1 Tax=Haloferula sp. A504 TaxID=3373601 RepID=UPI0031C6169F|nr:LysM peptidoglycan-binding domain-containing protein [Verrucomicrobiaceae bacterium E54]
MRTQRLTVKRRSARKRGLTTLFANVARKRNKRHRAATTASSADFEGDVPNLGIARALIVILAIHVVAIAGIFFHSHWLEGENDKMIQKPAAKPVQPAALAVVADEPDLPKIRSGDSLYTVGTGDTYEGIASRFGIDETELRSANDNIPLRQGRYLRIPPKTITAVEPAEFAEIRAGGQPTRVEPVAPVVQETGSSAPPAAGLVVTDAARQVDARAAGEDVPDSTTSTGGYKVKPGDTFWAIAQKHGTSVDKLMALNGIDDPKRLRVGMDLKLP